MTIHRALMIAGILAAGIPAHAAHGQASAPAAPAGTERPITFITSNGDFQTVFKTIAEARTKANGNAYNRTLREGAEVIVLNSRCDGQYGYSLFRPYEAVTAAIEPVFSTASASRDIRRQAIDKVLAVMATRFPRKKDCDALPVEVSSARGMILRLERDDVGVPLVDGRINDAYVVDATQLSSFDPAKNTGSAAITGGMTNGFADEQRAILAGVRLPGTKVAVRQGGKTYLYRANATLTSENGTPEAMVAALKASKPAKGFTFRGIVIGSGPSAKAVPIN